MITRRDLLAGAVAAVGVGTRTRASNAPDEWTVGAASTDITPTPGIWMAGFAARREASTGTALPLKAKALALRQGGNTVVLVTLDLLGVTEDLARFVGLRAALAHGLWGPNLILASSHTHCGPVVGSQLSVAYDLTPAQRAAIGDYDGWLCDAILRTIGRALDQHRPARVSWGQGRASFGANRRSQFLPPGPVDDSVPVLRVWSGNEPVAIVFGYACHNTTLQADTVQFHGDYAGVAQRELERRYPGVQAMFVSGCGADVNPAPRGTIALVERHGGALADAVSATLDGSMRPLMGPPLSVAETVPLPFASPPDYAEWVLRQQSDDVYVRRHATLMLQQLARDGRLEPTHPQSIYVWRLGALTLVALSGEVVTDYSLRLKREHASAGLWVAAYCNDVSCYVPSGRVLQEGGYEGGGAMIYYGRPGPFDPSVEERIVTAAGRLMRRLGVS